MILSLEKESSRTSSFDIDGLRLMIVLDDSISSSWLSNVDECQFDICIVHKLIRSVIDMILSI